MRNSTILIAGAGPSGLVLALALAKRGLTPRIIDKAEGPGLASRAMAVHARTLEFYHQLGLAETIVGQGIRMTTMHLREGGREVARIPIGEIGAGLSPFPFVLTYPQDDHERMLVAALAELGVAVEWGVTLTSFSQDETGVRAVLAKGGAEETCEVAYLCGCDGGHSTVRQGLDLGFPGGTYTQRFYVADVKLAGDFDTDGTMNLGAKTLALRLPVRSSGMQRLIGLVPKAMDGRQDLTFEDLRATAESLVGASVESINWFSTYHSHHRVAASFKVGRCFLLGDAGHIHSPAGGQGMNTGIGDAINLAWKLAGVVRARASPAILDSYEPERIAFARKLVATTDRAFTGAIQGGAVGQLMRTKVMPGVLPTLLRLPVFRRLAFNTISQTRISYRQSPLSAGEAGPIHGGDRLPWVEALDNFRPLTSLDWQLHVYGDVRQPLADTAVALGVTLYAFPWREEARTAGFERNAGYLVRPDGHVGLAMPDQDPRALRRYFGTHALSLAG